jgi:hypothetical protein
LWCEFFVLAQRWCEVILFISLYNISPILLNFIWGCLCFASLSLSLLLLLWTTYNVWWIVNHAYNFSKVLNLWAHMQHFDEIVHLWEHLILMFVTLNENDLMRYNLWSCQLVHGEQFPRLYEFGEQSPNLIGINSWHPLRGI